MVSKPEIITTRLGSAVDRVQQRDHAQTVAKILQLREQVDIERTRGTRDTVGAR